MSKALDKWFDFLKDRPLPALAPVGIRIQQQLNRLSSSQQDFAELLFLDPGMAVELFRTIARLPKAREPILTLGHAISMVGLKPLQVAALRMPSIERLPKEAHEGMRLCYSRAIHAAYYARCWALRLGLQQPEEIGLAALVDECGEMSLWANAPQQMLAINQRRAKGYTTDDAALQVLGTELNRLSLALANHWALPPLVAESLERNVYEVRPLCAQLASHFARTTDTSWVNHKSALLVELCSDFLGMSEDGFVGFSHQLAAELAREGWYVGVPMTINNLPMVAGEGSILPGSQARPAAQKPKQPEARPLASTGGKQAAKAASKPQAEPLSTGQKADAPEQPIPQPASEPSISATPSGQGMVLEELGLNEKLDRPAAEATEPTETTQAKPPAPDPGTPETAGFLQAGAMKLLIHLNKHLKLPRCLFARLCPDATLRVEVQAGVNQAPLRAFHYSTNNRLFEALLKQPQAVWIKAANRDRYQQLLPVTSQGIWSNADIFLMSVFCHGQPLGLVYVDANGHNLDQASYNAFKLRVQRFSQLLEEHNLCPTPASNTKKEP